MADIISNVLTGIRRAKKLMSVPFPNRASTTLSATFAAIGQAFAMAYAAPYLPRPPVTRDAETEDRDPSW